MRNKITDKGVLQVYKYFFIGYRLRSRQVRIEDGSFRIFIRPSIFGDETADDLIYSYAAGVYL